MESIREYNVRGEIKRWVELPNKISNEDAYLIGYLACDGGYIGSSNSPFMMVNSTESSLIHWVKANYIPDGTITNVGKKSSEKVNAINDVFEIRFTRRASKQFARFGIFDYKRNRRVVGISNHRLDAYVAGVIDSDGFITVTHRKDCRTPRLRWFITHGSELFLADLQSRIEVPTTLRQHGKRVWRLQAQNTEANKGYLDSIKVHLKNSKKLRILNDYLNKYYVPQASGELLESESQSAAKPHEVEGSETR